MAIAHLAFSPAIFQQGFGQTAQLGQVGQPQPQIVILTMLEGPVIAACGQHRITAVHARRMAKRGAVMHSLEEALVISGVFFAVARQGLAIGIDFVGPGADDTVIGIRSKKGELPLEALGVGHIVCVHPRYDWRARFSQQLVEAGDQAAIVAVNGANPGVRVSIVVDDGGCSVAGAIVEN